MRLLTAAALVLAAALVGTPGVVLAAKSVDPIEARYTSGLNRCLATPDGLTDSGMRDCVGHELDIQDGRLNSTYRKAMALLNARQRAKLQVAQRAWVAFRDANCDSMWDDDWGTISRLNAIQCRLHMTVERTIELEGFPPP